MLEFFIAVVSGLGSTVVWELGKRTRSLALVQNPLRRFYCFKGQERIIVVQSAVPNQDPEEYYKFIATPDCVIGYHAVSTQLNEAKFAPQRIVSRFAPQVGPEDMKCDIISIGGYENNQISAELNKRPRPLYLKDNQIRVTGDDSLVWGIELDDQNRIKRDYCLVSRQESPLQDDGRWLVGFEGVRHFGTEAGVRFIDPKNFRKEPLARVKSGQALYMVISCDVTHFSGGDYHLSDIRLEYIWYDGAGRMVRRDESND